MPPPVPQSPDMTPMMRSLYDTKRHQTHKNIGATPARLNPDKDYHMCVDKLVSTGCLGLRVPWPTVESRIQKYVQTYQDNEKCNHLKLSQSEEIKEGLFLVARFFSKNRYIVLRGIVLGLDQADQKMVQVLLVDALQVRSIAREALYHITSDFRDNPFLAIVVELAGVPKLFNSLPASYDKLMREFIEENKSKELIVRLVEDGDYFQKVSVALPDNGPSLSEILKQKLVSGAIGKIPTKAESVLGTICYARSNGVVFMHMDGCIMADLSDFLIYECSKKIGTDSRTFELNKDDMYIAPYEDVLYRVNIEKIDGEMIRVRYIDYGNHARVTKDNLIPVSQVDPILAQIPPLCVQFNLKGVGKIDVEKFQDFYDEQFEVVVKEEGSPPTVVLVNPTKDELDDDYYLNKHIIVTKIATK